MVYKYPIECTPRAKWTTSRIKTKFDRVHKLCTSSRWAILDLVLGWRWLGVCNQEVPWRMCGSCWTMWRGSKDARPWPYHVYDPKCKSIFTIIVCDMQSEDTMFPMLHWYSLIEHMKLHQVPKLRFYGVMVDFAQASWSDVWFVFGNGHAKEPMEGMERSCEFH